MLKNGKLYHHYLIRSVYYYIHGGNYVEVFVDNIKAGQCEIFQK